MVSSIRRAVPAFIFAVACFSSVQAATITVNSLADGPPTADSNCTLREAILAANEDADANGCVASGTYGADTVELPQAGTITLTGAAGDDSGVSGDLDIKEGFNGSTNADVTIVNVSGGTVIIDGGGIDRVIDFPNSSDTSITLEGLIIQNGHIVQNGSPTLAEAAGGGIRLFSSATLTLIDCVVRNNSVTGNSSMLFNGGGIYANASSVSLLRSAVVQNSLNNAGADAWGGGIVLFNGPLEIVSSRISGNTVTANGGGHAGGINHVGSAAGAHLIVKQSEVANNQVVSLSSNAFTGGLLHNGSSPFFLINSTISGNTVTANAPGALASLGGINTGGAATLSNSTLVNNQVVATNGTATIGGLRVDNAQIANTIIANNTANGAPSDCAANNISSAGYNLVETNCGITAAAGDQFGVDPQLAPLADNGGINTNAGNPQTHAPQAGSPVIDAGNPGPVTGFPNCEAGDQRSFGRPAHGGTSNTCDIGAHEAAAVLPLQPGTLQFTQAAYSVDEGGSMVNLTVERVNGSDGQVTVQYASSDNTAQAPGDYGAVNGTLTFPDGVTIQTFTVIIVDDTGVEGAEDFNVALSNPGGGAVLGAAASAIIAITDNEQAQVIPVPALRLTGLVIVMFLLLGIGGFALVHTKRRVMGVGAG